MTKTIHVYGTYTVDLGEELSFNGVSAFDYGQVNPIHPPVVINQGSVSVTSHHDGLFQGVTGVVSSDFDVIQATFWNKAGASFSVATSGDNEVARGFEFTSGDTLIRNDGEITISSAFSTAFGVDSQASSGGPAIVNTGHFSVQAAAYAVGFVGRFGVSLDNSGLIEVTGSTAQGVDFQVGDFTNSGTIDVVGQSGDSVGASFGVGAFSFHNSGTLSVTVGGEAGGVGVLYDNFYSPEFKPVLYNSGLIQAGVAIRESSYNNAHAASTIHNSGQIVGDIQLNLDNDRIINTGEITGEVDLGDGNDLYRGIAGQLTGAIYGGDGSDLILGGKGADLMFGDDRFNPDIGGADTLSGGKGADSIDGGRRADVLSGDGGNDVLTGGGGADLLTGGSGADSFVYRGVGESLVGLEDLITDLGEGDIVDVSHIDAIPGKGNQAFTLVGSFDGHAGQATLTYDAGGDVTTLALDIDGDGAADAAIHMTGDQTAFTGFVL